MNSYVLLLTGIKTTVAEVQVFQFFFVVCLIMFCVLLIKTNNAVKMQKTFLLCSVIIFGDDVSFSFRYAVKPLNFVFYFGSNKFFSVNYLRMLCFCYYYDFLCRFFKTYFLVNFD